MKKYLSLLALAALGGCQSLGIGVGQPAQVGKNKFELSYFGMESSGLQDAQNFCTSRGYSYAAIIKHSSNKLTFLCMREGEHLNQSASRSANGRIICMDAAGGAKVCGQF
jgi:hypothetical protein